MFISRLLLSVFFKALFPSSVKYPPVEHLPTWLPLLPLLPPLFFLPPLSPSIPSPPSSSGCQQVYRITQTLQVCLQGLLSSLHSFLISRTNLKKSNQFSNFFLKTKASKNYICVLNPNFTSIKNKSLFKPKWCI